MEEKCGISAIGLRGLLSREFQNQRMTYPNQLITKSFC